MSLSKTAGVSQSFSSPYLSKMARQLGDLRGDWATRAAEGPAATVLSLEVRLNGSGLEAGCLKSENLAVVGASAAMVLLLAAAAAAAAAAMLAGNLFFQICLGDRLIGLGSSCGSSNRLLLAGVAAAVGTGRASAGLAGDGAPCWSLGLVGVSLELSDVVLLAFFMVTCLLRATLPSEGDLRPMGLSRGRTGPALVR